MRARREIKYGLHGWPAVFLAFIPMAIGWVWIISTLVKAVV